MALRIDPRADLPLSIVQSKSYHIRPDMSTSSYKQTRSITHENLPNLQAKKKLCYDWIFSSASNVHIAVDRSNFRQYVSFKSYVLAVGDQRQIPVKGIGTVEIKIKRQPGSKEYHKILLENVLHVPGWLCNVVSDTLFTPAKTFDHEWSEFGVRF